MHLLQFPLAKVTIGFILGLLVAFYFVPGMRIGIGVVLCGFTILGFSYFFVKKHIIHPIFFGSSVIIFSFALGVFTQVLHNDVLAKNHYMHHINGEQQIVNLTLKTKLKPNAYNYRYYAQVKSIDNQKSSGIILIGINKQLYSSEPQIGTNYEVYSKIIPNSIPKNPSQFDYGKYLKKQQVYAQIYTDTTNIRKLKTEKTLYYYTYKIRNRILDQLKNSGFAEEELTVLHALILGQQQDISPEILEAYQFAGAVHILSVSGLHVAYIYLFLNFVLKFIPNHKKGKLLKLLVLLFSLWGFALLAGMAPAIVRAVTMFSFVAVGQFLSRGTNVLYTLLVSMLLILLWNPSFLFDVGFQLSYLALFFIVWAKPVFDRFFQPKNRAMKYIWDVATVSLAAQIGVLPLSLYYFNQFPTLFIITNLLVLLPLSVFMIYGVVLSILAFFGITHFYLSKIMEYGIWYINQVSIEIAKFESFVLKDIPFNIWMLLGWYLLIFTFFIWMKTRNFLILATMFSSILILQSIYIFTQIKVNNSNEFIVFNKNRTTLLSERIGNNIVFYTNDSINENDYLTKSYKVGSFSKIKSIDSLQNFFFINEKKLMIIDSSAVYNKNLSPDVILLTGSPKINLKRLIQTHQPEIVIADASNYKSYVELWKTTCQKNKIRFHSTYENGYYKIEK